MHAGENLGVIKYERWERRQGSIVAPMVTKPAYYLTECVYKYKLAWPRKAFYLATFFQYNKRLLRQKTGGACLYMPQDGHWLASFEVIPPPKKS